MVSVDEDEDVQFHIPSPKVTTYGVTYNFDTPVALPQLWGTTEKDSDSQDAASEYGDDGQEDGSQAVRMTISTGISGGLAQPVQKATVEYEDGTEGEETVCFTRNIWGWRPTDVLPGQNAAHSGSSKLPTGRLSEPKCSKFGGHKGNLG